MAITRTAHVTKDTWIAQAVGGTTNYGNGTTPKITVGPAVGSAATYKGRGLFEIPLIDDVTGAPLFAGIATLTAAALKLTVANTECAARGSTQRIFLERLQSSFSLNTASGNCVVATSGVASAKWPGPTATTTNRVLFTASNPSTGTVLSVDILTLLQASMAAGATVFRFRLIAANGAGDGYAESTAARTITFLSSKAANTADRPYIEITGDAVVDTDKSMSLAIAVSLAMTVSSTTADSEFAVDGQRGTIRLTQPDTARTALLDGVSEQDVDVTVQFSLDKTPAAGVAVFRLIARALDELNYYRLAVRVSATGVIEARLVKVIAGAATTLATRTDVGVAFIAGTMYNVRLKAVGATPTLLYGKVWANGTVEPDWKVTASDSAAALQAAATLGIGVQVTTLTNLPLKFSVDELNAVAVV